MKAFAPASIANVAVGFDLLGFSFDVSGDIVSVNKISKPEVIIRDVQGLTTDLPLDSLKNTATAGLVRMINDFNLPFGFEVSIEKGIALGSGMGGSAASAVAAVVAANTFLPKSLNPSQLISYALVGEIQASGSAHSDNVAASLLGGLTLARVREERNGLPRVEVQKLPLPKDIYCVLIHPHLILKTREARQLLHPQLSLKNHLEQSANLAGFITGCFLNDLELIGRSLYDIVIEPQRAALIPGFYEVKKVAMDLGALGCSIAGAGPSVFAWVKGQNEAEKMKLRMRDCFFANGLKSESWISPLNTNGARIIN